MTFAEWVRALRRAMDVTQFELAHLIGASLSTIARWESGERTAAPRLRKRLQALHQTVTAKQ